VTQSLYRTDKERGRVTHPYLSQTSSICNLLCSKENKNQHLHPLPKNKKPMKFTLNINWRGYIHQKTYKTIRLRRTLKVPFTFISTHEFTTYSIMHKNPFVISTHPPNSGQPNIHIWRKKQHEVYLSIIVIRRQTTIQPWQTQFPNSPCNLTHKKDVTLFLTTQATYQDYSSPHQIILCCYTILQHPLSCNLWKWEGLYVPKPLKKGHISTSYIFL